jgi:8-oxo-dGTP diphosphatase
VKLGEVFLLPRINEPLLAAVNGSLRDPFIDRW